MTDNTRLHLPYYLATVNNTNPVYFEIPPVPIPVFKPVRRGSIKTMLSSVDDSGNVVAGNTVVIDGGVSVTGQVLEFVVSRASETVYQAVLALFNATSTVCYSGDNGTTVYELAWHQDGFQPSCEGFLSSYVLKFKFQVIRQVR